MADVKTNLKKAWLKSMEAIGSAATNIASNTRYKVDEMNMVNRRREILTDFGAQAYAMWQRGVSFPDELEKQLTELSDLDAKLNALRTERLAGVNTAKAPADAPAPTDAADAPAADASSDAVSAPDADEAEQEPADDNVPVLEVESPQAPDADEAVADDPADSPAPDAPTLDVPGESTVDELIAKGQKLTEQVKQTLSDADVGGKVDNAMDKMSDTIHSMSDSINRSLEDKGAQSKVDDAIGKVNDTMNRMGSAIGKAVNSMADMLKGDKKDE